MWYTIHGMNGLEFKDDVITLASEIIDSEKNLFLNGIQFNPTYFNKEELSNLFLESLNSEKQNILDTVEELLGKFELYIYDDFAGNPDKEQSAGICGTTLLHPAILTPTLRHVDCSLATDTVYDPRLRKLFLSLLQRHIYTEILSKMHEIYNDVISSNVVFTFES